MNLGISPNVTPSFKAPSFKGNLVRKLPQTFKELKQAPVRKNVGKAFKEALQDTAALVGLPLALVFASIVVTASFSDESIPDATKRAINEANDGLKEMEHNLEKFSNKAEINVEYWGKTISNELNPNTSADEKKAKREELKVVRDLKELLNSYNNLY